MNEVYYLQNSSEIKIAQSYWPHQEVLIVIPTIKKGSIFNVHSSITWAGFNPHNLYTNTLTESKKYRSRICVNTFTPTFKVSNSSSIFGNSTLGNSPTSIPASPIANYDFKDVVEKTDESKFGSYVVNVAAHQFAFLLYMYQLGMYNYFLHDRAPKIFLDMTVPLAQKGANLLWIPDNTSSADMNEICKNNVTCNNILNFEYPTRFLIDVFRILPIFQGGSSIDSTLYSDLLHNTFLYKLIEHVGFADLLESNIQNILRLNNMYVSNCNIFKVDL